VPEHVHLVLSEARHDAVRDRNAPLKPKDGLNGTPIEIGRLPQLRLLPLICRLRADHYCVLHLAVEVGYCAGGV